MSARVAYSFVVDRGARFAYQAWHLAHSLVHFCDAAPSDINIQCTREADAAARRLFDRAGFRTHDLTRFGDGKYCNKISQFEAFAADWPDILVLLDTDTIAVGDMRPWLARDRVLAKVVDGPNPPIATLLEIASTAGVHASQICVTDDATGKTLVGNCNGGMYAIPGQYCASLAREWRRWALWLLRNAEPLHRSGRVAHVDQVSFWLALEFARIPYEPAASNLNYFTHQNTPHAYYDPAREIALLHYHDVFLTPIGQLRRHAHLEPAAKDAVDRANAQISRCFNEPLFRAFWDQQMRERRARAA